MPVRFVNYQSPTESTGDHAGIGVNPSTNRLEIKPETGAVQVQMHVVTDAYAANGAITVSGAPLQVSKLTKGSAAAMTLAAPSAAQEGCVLIVSAQTAHAHTVTIAGGANGGSTATDVGTFGGAIGDGFMAVAINEKWNIVSNSNVTFA